MGAIETILMESEELFDAMRGKKRLKIIIKMEMTKKNIEARFCDLKMMAAIRKTGTMIEKLYKTSQILFSTIE